MKRLVLLVLMAGFATAQQPAAKPPEPTIESNPMTYSGCFKAGLSVIRGGQ